MVGEEARAALRKHLRLVLHVLTAAGEEEKRGKAEEDGELWCSPTLATDHPSDEDLSLGTPVSR